MSDAYSLVCLSHLRWDFVFQRPQHLLSRSAKARQVLFVEEPVFGDGPTRWEVKMSSEGVTVCVPFLPDGANPDEALRPMLPALLAEQNIANFALWYYTPMAVEWAQDVHPRAVIYDCMDELSAFRGAPPALLDRERQLLARADLVFTGGQSLYEAKRNRAEHVYLFPSSVDVPHFAQARKVQEEPADQKEIGHPRLGFFGVIDERFDTDLLGKVAALRPEWQWVVLGPVVKIDPDSLPTSDNIHYLGGKSYADLPAYLSGWDVALLLFARNDSTRFISPTKTPEYLAAGRPVVSTSIQDVVQPYGVQGLVRIADTPEAFVEACEAAMTEDGAARQTKVDAFLSHLSWDDTWRRMEDLITSVVKNKNTQKEEGYV